MRIDHLNCQVPEIEPLYELYEWYTKTWGFRCSDYTETEDSPPRLWAAWLHRKSNVHDLALMNGIGPRLHHAGFWVLETINVIRACDIPAGAGMHTAIERDPGRHGISNALFVYLRDPDRPPIRWSINAPRRQTFWGHAAPRSWFDEASNVEDILTRELRPTLAAGLPDLPRPVT